MGTSVGSGSGFGCLSLPQYTTSWDSDNTLARSVTFGGWCSLHPSSPPSSASECPQPPPARPQSEPDHPAAGPAAAAPPNTSTRPHLLQLLPLLTAGVQLQLLASCSCMCWAGLLTAPRCWSRRARWQAAVSWPCPGRPQLP